MLDYMFDGVSQLGLPVSILPKAVNTLESILGSYDRAS